MQHKTTQLSREPKLIALEYTKLRKESSTQIQENKLRTLHPLKINQILFLPSFVKLLKMLNIRIREYSGKGLDYPTLTRISVLRRPFPNAYNTVKKHQIFIKL